MKIIITPLKNFLKKKLLFPLINFLEQGITTEKLALSLALGISVGVIPLIGVNAVLLLFLAIILRLNIIAVQLINLFVYPLQFVLYVPFMKIGQFIFNGPDFPMSSRQFVKMIRNDWWGTLTDFWFNNVLGIIAWLILAIPVGIIIYYYSLPIIKRYAHLKSNMDEFNS